MDDRFNIYIEQVREKSEEKIDLTLDPHFLEIDEKDLKFDHPVSLIGEVYVADKELVFHWNLETEAKIPCSICNEWTPVKVAVSNFYTSVPISEIKTGIYNFKELLRETILIEVPHFVECEGGNCPKRKEFSVYLKKSSDSSSQEEGYHPFADL